MTYNILFALITAVLLISCQSPEPSASNRNLSDQEKAYWYTGEAEIASYRLSQVRYGEMRAGHAVLIFVTEPFSTDSWSKTDNPGEDDISVMKLNFTKKFTTGIYPYSMMTSTFLPYIMEGQNSLKISSSSQEWCGHTYMELRNNSHYEIGISSYFEGENQNLSLKKDLLEDDIWTLIRKDPSSLPTGTLNVIPSFFYLRLKHQETKAYECNIDLITGDSTSTYTLDYPTLDRSLSIEFESKFPHKILGWKETYPEGFGDPQMMTTSAELLTAIKSDYWTKNAVKDSVFREKLLLE